MLTEHWIFFSELVSVYWRENRTNNCTQRLVLCVQEKAGPANPAPAPALGRGGAPSPRVGCSGTSRQNKTPWVKRMCLDLFLGKQKHRINTDSLLEPLSVSPNCCRFKKDTLPEWAGETEIQRISSPKQPQFTWVRCAASLLAPPSLALGWAVPFPPARALHLRRWCNGSAILAAWWANRLRALLCRGADIWWDTEAIAGLTTFQSGLHQTSNLNNREEKMVVYLRAGDFKVFLVALFLRATWPFLSRTHFSPKPSGVSFYSLLFHPVHPFILLFRNDKMHSNIPQVLRMGLSPKMCTLQHPDPRMRWHVQWH